jgi:hypothetical protein
MSGVRAGNWNEGVDGRMRDLRRYVDRHGNIHVHVEILGEDEFNKHTTGASASPRTVANFLRELADDVDRLDPHQRLQEEGDR